MKGADGLAELSIGGGSLIKRLDNLDAPHVFDEGLFMAFWELVYVALLLL